LIVLGRVCRAHG